MQQIAVRAVHLDGIDAEPIGALGGIDKGIADPRKARRVERKRRRLALLVRHSGRSDRLPAAL